MVIFKVKIGCELNVKWDEVFEKDEDFEILFKSRKNFEKSFLYILKLKKNKELKLL